MSVKRKILDDFIEKKLYDKNDVWRAYNENGEQGLVNYAKNAISFICPPEASKQSISASVNLVARFLYDTIIIERKSHFTEMPIDNEFKRLVSTPDYDFLRNNPHLQNRIMLLALGGSHAYGTNVETSDVDIRGCAFNSPSDLLGMSSFEQVNDNKTDTVIYSFNKLVNLLLNCNPNVIEILGCKPEHYLFLSQKGKELLKNRHLFLSQRAENSFGGYATQQLRRLENALARDSLSQAQQEEHIRGALERSINQFADKHSAPSKYGSIDLFTGPSTKDDFELEVLCNVSLKDYPVRDFQTLINTLSAVVSSYNKLNHRNNKDEEHLNKHAMHLIRLYLMCLDILEKEEINTYREKERDMLLGIRNGEYQKEDGTYRSEFFDMVTEYEKKLTYAKKHTNLPKEPNMKRIEELVMDINYSSLMI